MRRTKSIKYLVSSSKTLLEAYLPQAGKSRETRNPPRRAGKKRETRSKKQDPIAVRFLCAYLPQAGLCTFASKKNQNCTKYQVQCTKQGVRSKWCQVQEARAKELLDSFAALRLCEKKNKKREGVSCPPRPTCCRQAGQYFACLPQASISPAQMPQHNPQCLLQKPS